jgi:hypothetical protein
LKPSCLLVLLFISFCGIAQKTISLKTHLVGFDKKPIENGYALLYSAADSTLLQTRFSDKKGRLEIELELNQDYFCRVSKDSFTSISFPLLKGPFQFPDTIVLEKNFQNETVLIIASPIVIKDDTVQFNNELFKKDSIRTLEEVLKKFPGVTIDREGNIEINGQKVSEILLDGKPLPVTDIKSFTQTLQAGLIDKIQFIDRKSDEAKISKIDNGQRDKVINIKLKNKNKKSHNQDFYAGIGNNKRYEGRTNLNRIHNDFFINAAININNSGRNEYGNINYFNPNGISSGLNSNLNMRYTGYKKWTLGLNLGFSKQKTIFDEYRDRVIFLKDSLNYYQQKLYTTNHINNYQSNINISFLPDTLGEFKFYFTTNFSDLLNEREEDFISRNNSKQLVNNGNKTNNGSVYRGGFNSSITGVITTKNGNASFYTSANFSYNSNADKTFQKNDILFYKSTGLAYDTTKQLIRNSGYSNAFRANINFYKKIIGALKLNAGSGISISQRPSNRSAYLYDDTAQEYAIPNTILFNDNLNQTKVVTQSIGLVYALKGQNFAVTLNFNRQYNKNIDRISDTTLFQNNTYRTPSFSHSYFNKKFWVNNTLSVSQRNPTSQQLQPIIDNSNPLFIRKGNPDLKNEQTMNFSSTITKKADKSGFSFNFYNTLILLSNKIANNTFFDATEGKQVSVPINLPKTFSDNLSVAVNRYFEKEKLNLSARLGAGFGRDNNYLNGELNRLTNFSIRPNLGIKLNRKKYFFDYAIGYLYQTNTYSLRPTQNIEIGNFTTDASMTLLMIRNFEIGFDYQQTVNNNKRSIQKINNLNGKISYTPKWKPKTTFAISLFDVLNQNSNTRQNINDYYEEYVSTNAIRRFLLFSVNVKLNKFKAKKK